MTFCVWKKWTKQAISRLFLITLGKCYIPQLVREIKQKQWRNSRKTRRRKNSRFSFVETVRQRFICFFISDNWRSFIKCLFCSLFLDAKSHHSTCFLDKISNFFSWKIMFCLSQNTTDNIIQSLKIIKQIFSQKSVFAQLPQHNIFLKILKPLPLLNFQKYILYTQKVILQGFL